MDRCNDLGGLGECTCVSHHTNCCSHISLSSEPSLSIHDLVLEVSLAVEGEVS